ncbi:M28 family peptidase [bacterium]|nr:M28 family peptidase [bacterium]
MNGSVSEERVRRHMVKLCESIGNRHVGSAGNHAAVDYAREVLQRSGWTVETPEFPCVDWTEGTARLIVDGKARPAKVSPYSLSYDGEATMIAAASNEELAATDIRGRIVLLHGEIAREQIMPKNFVFYNPDHHQRIVALLEEKQPAALLCATGKNPEVAGSVYPFPLFEDGDFDIPSVYMKDVDAEALLAHAGQKVRLTIESERIASTARNVIARRAGRSDRKIVFTAHIDAKLGTPGALDNGTGVAALLQTAEAMQDMDPPHTIEIALLNGEDYYAVPGQMHYLHQHEGRWDSIRMVVNLDGTGYRDGRTAWSLYGVDEELRHKVERLIEERAGFMIGEPWYQGDHSMFVQKGVPAVAITSERFEMLCRDITHTAQDNLSQVETGKIADVAAGLVELCTSQAAVEGT